MARTGGTAKKVVVYVSGEAYIDLEMEAIAAMKRDQAATQPDGPLRRRPTVATTRTAPQGPATHIGQK